MCPIVQSPLSSAFEEPNSITQGDTIILCLTIPLSFASFISIWVLSVEFL